MCQSKAASAVLVYRAGTLNPNCSIRDIKQHGSLKNLLPLLGSSLKEKRSMYFHFLALDNFGFGHLSVIEPHVCVSTLPLAHSRWCSEN